MDRMSRKNEKGKASLFIRKIVEGRIGEGFYFVYMSGVNTRANLIMRIREGKMRTVFAKFNGGGWDLVNGEYEKVDGSKIMEADRRKIEWRKIEMEEIGEFVGERLYNEWIIEGIL